MDGMELLTKASVLEHLMRGPHHCGIKLLPSEVAVFEQPSSAWLIAMLKELDEEHLRGDLNTLNANATTIITSIQEFYRHPGRFIRLWCKADAVWARQRLRLYGAHDRALKQFFKTLDEDMAEVSMERHGHASSQEATLAAASEPGPSTPPPAKRSKRTKAEQAAEPTQPTKAAKAKPAPQPGRWLDWDCNAALNMQRIGESRWRPLELCYWPDQGALPAKGKESL
ncbi:hypothetical protein HaLaN_03010 [Haematococcus lacustris]|uniref:Uncharacterized protein n=1 Tax=Haematococcus lacustris TaxID=44745 RepID=A0A699YPK9_HAELA|nr:hypothetical protein HaLaN_03010 [Haematococcus lacustris]